MLARLAILRSSLDIFHQQLNKWYAQHGRHDLPWRNTSDPYAIWISEVMLQQTQVATVKAKYYPAFLARFPTIKALAEAELSEVLSLWQGLGYYSRARNLHTAARAIAPHYQLPDDVTQLMALSGIGRNTAHAIVAFGFHKPYAVLEANVKRVASRIFALETPTQAELWDAAEKLLNTAKPFDYNQAMMDLGSLICTVRDPNCTGCPAKNICKGKSNPTRYPTKVTAKKVPVRQKTIVIAHSKNGYIWATPRSGKFLHGLYHFIELEEESSFAVAGKNYTLKQTKPLGHVTQQYSHFRLEAEVWLLEVASVKVGVGWNPLSALKTLPFSNAEHKMMALLSKQFIN